MRPIRNESEVDDDPGFRTVADILNAPTPSPQKGKAKSPSKGRSEQDEDAQAYANRWMRMCVGLIDWRYPSIGFAVMVVDMVATQRGTPFMQLIWQGVVVIATSGPLLCAVQTKRAVWIQWACQSGAATALGLFAAKLLLITLGLKNV